MKTLGIVSGAVVVLALGIYTASAAELAAAISNTGLDSMGLAGMRAMSDAEGLGVRGKGVFVKSGDHKKPELRCDIPRKGDHVKMVDHKKVDHGKGFDKKVDHKGMDKVSHKNFDGHKGMGKDFGGHKGGGLVWHAFPKLTWNSGGGFKGH